MSTTTATPPVVDPRTRRGTGAIAGLGVALLGAATAVSAFYAREDGELDWSNYAVGLGATAALLLVTLAGALHADLGLKRALTGFPGAVGAIAAGTMVGVGFDDEDWLPWAVGGVILGVSVLAYLLGRAGAPTVSAIAGLAILYGKAVEELLDVDDDQTLITGGAIVVVFVVVVTAIGWALPHRALIGTVVGVGGILGIAGLLAFTTFTRSLFSGSMAVPGEVGPIETGAGDIENDVYVLLGYSAALVLMWTLAAWASGSSGFRVLAVVHSAAIAPLSMVVLAVEHPSWWSGGLAVAGGLVLLVALVGAAKARRRDRPPPSTEPPPPFFDSPPPPATPGEGTPAASPNPPPGTSDATVIAPASAPPPPAPGDRRPT